MSRTQKWKLLYIEDTNSEFSIKPEFLKALFQSVDIVATKENALELFEHNSYDIILSDLSVEPTKLALLKQLKDLKSKQSIFALVLPKDTDKLYGIADLNINAFELVPEQFEQALEMIAEFDPYKEQ